MKRREIAQGVLINCNAFYFLRNANGQMHTNVIIHVPAAKITFKSQTKGHSSFTFRLVCVHLPIQLLYNHN